VRARWIQSTLVASSVKSHFNAILPFTPISTKWSLSFKSSDKDLVCISPFPHVCYMPHPSHPSWSDYRSVLPRVQITKLLVTKFSAVSYHFLALVPVPAPVSRTLSIYVIVCLFVFLTVFRDFFLLLFLEWLFPYFPFVLPYLHLSSVFSPSFNLLFVSTSSQYREFRLAGLA
jgi:hypothetical protein